MELVHYTFGMHGKVLAKDICIANIKGDGKSVARTDGQTDRQLTAK